MIVRVLGDICMTFNNVPCLHLTHGEHQIEVCQSEINGVFIALAPLIFCGGGGLGDMRYP